jgi:deoxyhypusine monooxygenase
LIEYPGFQDESALLKHELAYCLGQMKDTSALPILGTVLENKSEDPMVRHEVIVLRYPE